MRMWAFLLVLCGSVLARAGSVTISAAVSLKESLTAIGKIYESGGGDHVDFNFAASGPLAAQIEQGAPVDGFISAANKQVEELVKAGVADEKSRRVIVRNEIVLVVPGKGESKISAFENLKDAGRVAVGQPQSVPAGMYAMQTLKSMKLSDAVAGKIVYGGSVRQVLDYVERGEVDAGIVYATDAQQAGTAVKVVATAAADSHEAIEYPAVVIKGAKQAEGAEKFFEFLGSAAARKVFVERGFLMPIEPPPAATP